MEDVPNIPGDLFRENDPLMSKNRNMLFDAFRALEPPFFSIPRRLGCRKRFAVRLSLADLAREGGPTVKRLAEVIRQGLGEASG